LPLSAEIKLSRTIKFLTVYELCWPAGFTEWRQLCSA